MKYKIIIPQEEPKQKKWDKLNKELDDALDAEFGSEEFKQETLKEAFERFMESNGNQRPTLGLVLGAFSAGIEWQAERMYSEEDLREAFENGVGSGKYQEKYGDNARGSMSFEYFIEQLKNK
jgi:hypothetical protein